MEYIHYLCEIVKTLFFYGAVRKSYQNLLLKWQKSLFSYVSFCVHSMLVHYKGWNTLCSKLQQHVAATDHIEQLVAATHCNDTSQQQITLCVLENFCEKSLTLQQNSVSATRWTNSVWFDFLQHFAATKFCCGDKDFHKNSPVHKKCN